MLKVDLYSGCNSDATSNAIVATEKRYYFEMIAFLSRRYYRFKFVLLSDFDNICFMISDGG
jgi:hypothetical protein